MTSKFDIIIEKIARVEEQNVAQTSAINKLDSRMDQHVQSSESFREACAKNKNDISWIKKAFGAIVTVVTGITVWIVSTFIVR